MSASDEMMLLPAMMDAELCIPLDVACDAACKKLGLPLLGGPSGRGNSFYSTAAVCPRLFEATHENGADGRERTHPAEEPQIGGFYHTLQAMYYAYGLGRGEVAYTNRGLLAPSLVDRAAWRWWHGNAHDLDDLSIPNDAADRLLQEMKRAAFADLFVSGEGAPIEHPSAAMILEAERLFDAHTNYYGSGEEDVTPLAIEWFAQHPKLPYTCRYDAIVRVDELDPWVRVGAAEPGQVYVHERKTSKWLSEWAREGWYLDGEILGQLLLWEPSGCADVFGPLAGLVIDVVTKEKTPKFLRVLVSPNPITTNAHAKVIQYQNAEISMWRATGYYPPRWVSCFRFGRKCGMYETCRAETAAEAEEMNDAQD